MRLSRTGGLGRLQRLVVASVAFSLALVGCEPPDLSLPTPEQVATYYPVDGSVDANMSGNVAEITVQQSSQQLRRGGTLWAKVGPYVFLFTDGTQRLFADFGGLAGVRVITTAPGGTEVARALLARDGLNELTWRRALNVAGVARRDGTDRPSRLESLVTWGEDHTDYEYNPRYIRR